MFGKPQDPLVLENLVALTEAVKSLGEMMLKFEQRQARMERALVLIVKAGQKRSTRSTSDTPASASPSVEVALPTPPPLRDGWLARQVPS